jgi:hypothetical protein
MTGYILLGAFLLLSLNAVIYFWSAWFIASRLSRYHQHVYLKVLQFDLFKNNTPSTDLAFNKWIESDLKSDIANDVFLMKVILLYRFLKKTFISIFLVVAVLIAINWNSP